MDSSRGMLQDDTKHGTSVTRTSTPRLLDYDRPKQHMFVGLRPKFKANRWGMLSSHGCDRLEVRSRSSWPREGASRRISGLIESMYSSITVSPLIRKAQSIVERQYERGEVTRRQHRQARGGRVSRRIIEVKGNRTSLGEAHNEDIQRQHT